MWLETPTEIVEITIDNRQDVIPLASKKTDATPTDPTLMPAIESLPSVHEIDVPAIPTNESISSNDSTV